MVFGSKAAFAPRKILSICVHVTVIRFVTPDTSYLCIVDLYYYTRNSNTILPTSPKFPLPSGSTPIEFYYPRSLKFSLSNLESIVVPTAYLLTAIPP